MSDNRLLRLEPEAYCITCLGETITLLPKEYALFAFLHAHPNQAFSRAELLDRVWGLEDPVDRTVDDHIYRLRKKLKGWAEICRIETVRGYGYKLVIRAAPRALPPVFAGELQEHALRLLQKYHHMGMGAAMRTLAANQDALGIELNRFYAAYIHFVSGDFSWIVETPAMDFWEKASYLLHIYDCMQFDARKVLPYFEAVLRQKDRLPQEWQKEIEMNAIPLYLRAGLLTQADPLLAEVEKLVASLHSPSFSLMLALHKLMRALLDDHHDIAEVVMMEAEQVLARTPMQRETGLMLTVKGIWCYRRGELEKARTLIDQGVAILSETRFVPHLLCGVQRVLHFLRTEGCDEAWRHKYELLWHNLAAQYQLAELEPAISALLRKHLSIL